MSESNENGATVVETHTEDNQKKGQENDSQKESTIASRTRRTRSSQGSEETEASVQAKDIALRDIAFIRTRLEKEKADGELTKELHNLLFNNHGSKNLRRKNVLSFTGLKKGETPQEPEEFKKKLEALDANFFEQLVEIVGVEGKDRDEKVAALVSFFEAPKDLGKQVPPPVINSPKKRGRKRASDASEADGKEGEQKEEGGEEGENEKMEDKNEKKEENGHSKADEEEHAHKKQKQEEGKEEEEKKEEEDKHEEKKEEAQEKKDEA